MFGRETALITGASGGIGRELALVFAQHQFDLVVLARRESELETLAKHCQESYGARVHLLPMDLLSQNAVEKLAQQLEDADLEIDVLVNNAGLMDMGEFAEIDVDRHERLVQLNVVVLATLTRRLLPGMIARGRGRILNVASTSAFQAVPSMALYAATKAFVLSLTESLSEELKGSGVTATALCPGLTKTEMLDRAQDEHANVQMPDFLISDVHDVALAGYEACISGRTVVVPGLPNQIMASTVGFYPRRIVRNVMGLIARRALRP